MKKIGLFGGSFNPIHNHHVKVAEIVAAKCELDEIIFIPANISPLKDPTVLASKDHRLNMVNIATTKSNIFSVSTYELDKTGPSFSIETIRHFKKKLPNSELFFIMGADSFETFDKWAAHLEIFKAINIIIYPRSEVNLKQVILNFPFIKECNSQLNDRLSYTTHGDKKLISLKGQQFQGSSTDVRENNETKNPNENLVNPEVLDYIKKNSLYSN